MSVTGEAVATDRSVKKLRELIDKHELWGAREVAEHLGVLVQNLSGPNQTRGLPEPVAHLRATRVWIASEIREFAGERDRRLGRS